MSKISLTTQNSIMGKDVGSSKILDLSVRKMQNYL